MTAFDSDVDNALHSSDRSGELRKLTQCLLAQGNSAQTLLDQFERMRQGLRATGRQEDEDAILDVMDFLTGWCSPHMLLPPASGDAQVR
jgi:hypothetical protein